MTTLRSGLNKVFWQWGDRIFALGVLCANVLILSYSAQTRSLAALMPLALALLVTLLVFRADKREALPPGRDGMIGLGLSLVAPYFLRPNLFVIANSWAAVLYALASAFYFLVVVWSYVSLKTSIAILPGARRVIDSGPYRMVRHPIYASYLHLAVCYTAYFPSLGNALASIAIATGLLLRSNNEERMLAAAPAYRELQARVPRFSTFWFSMPAAVTVVLLILLQS